jgi:hypothetical protein
VSIQTVTAHLRPQPTVQAIRWSKPEQWREVMEWMGKDPDTFNYGPENGEPPEDLYDTSGRPFGVGWWVCKDPTGSCRSLHPDSFARNFTIEVQP